MMKPNLLGMHHVTAITSSAERIYEFFTYVLGMRLVKKTVNQDDIHTYHLFFADDRGTAGTDMTFFDFPHVEKGRKGDNEIHRTAFRVPSDAALEYYAKRLDRFHVSREAITTLFGKKVLRFQDVDEQLYMLISDEHNQGKTSGTPWLKGPIPNEFAITGLGPITLRSTNSTGLGQQLVEHLGYHLVATEGDTSLYEVGEGGNGAGIFVEHRQGTIRPIQGYGSIHHVAFGVQDVAAIHQLIRHFDRLGYHHSGLVDRFYFQSLYVRMHHGMLFEFATEGPGFMEDEETYENLGETLALPPRFREKRATIEALVRPIDTVRSTKVFSKEYE